MINDMKYDNIKSLNENDIEIIINKLKNFYEEKEVEVWKNTVIKGINDLFMKYQVTKFSVNKDSYMGIVIDCNSSTKGDIFIKAVAPMLNRFESEIGTIKLLKKELVCDLYEIDYYKKIVVMEKLVPGTQVEFYRNKDLIQCLFKTLSENKIEINDFIRDNYKSFFEVVTNDYEICKKNGYNSKMIDSLYIMFCKKYQIIEKNNRQYLLHGDIYKNNMLLATNKLKLIDPLGFKAPFVFELLSICAYEMYYSKIDNKKILRDFLFFFEEYVDKQTYIQALFCQLVKVYIPSVYEANDGGKRAKRWLDIIEELYKQELQGDYYE